MDDRDMAFERGAVRPMQCLSEGWALVGRDFGMFLAISFVAMLLASLAPFGILYGPMMCGAYLCFLRALDRESPSFELLFRGFDHFGQSFIAWLCILVPMIVIVLPMYVGFVIFLIAFADQPGRRGPPRDGDVVVFFMVLAGLYVFLIVAITLIKMFTQFSFALIAERRLGGWDAVKTSIAGVWANFGGMLGVAFLNVGLAILGFAMCYIGILFVLPLMFAVETVAYRQIFPRESHDDDRDDYDDDDDGDSPPGRGYDAGHEGIRSQPRDRS